MSETITFPPLMTGEAAGPGQDPFDLACQKAELGVDAGLVVYELGTDVLRAALVLAPEVPLAKAMAMLPVCGVGFQNALGALAPPEVAVHLDWNGALRINGARCGRLRIAASTDDPDTQPDWLVVGLDLPLWPEGDGGETPDRDRALCRRLRRGHRPAPAGELDPPLPALDQPLGRGRA